MERKKISEENVFAKDHVKILKEIISGNEKYVNSINSDSRLTEEEKTKKLKYAREEIVKANEILNNPELLDAYVKFQTVSDIDMFAISLFGRTGLGIVKRPVSISMINKDALTREVGSWNIDEKDLIEFLKNKNTITVIEELYQKAGYEMPNSRFTSYDGVEYFDALGYSSIPQIYDAITRLSDKYVPESIESKSKGA